MEEFRHVASILMLLASEAHMRHAGQENKEQLPDWLKALRTDGRCASSGCCVVYRPMLTSISTCLPPSPVPAVKVVAAHEEMYCVTQKRYHAEEVSRRTNFRLQRDDPCMAW